MSTWVHCDGRLCNAVATPDLADQLWWKASKDGQLSHYCSTSCAAVGMMSRLSIPDQASVVARLTTPAKPVEEHTG